MFPYQVIIPGRVTQRFMIENVDICAYLVFLYLGMVRYGPAIAKRVLGETPKPVVPPGGKRPAPPPDPLPLRVAMVLWNLMLSGFSFFGAIVMIPSLFSAIRTNGMHNTVCVHHEELMYSGPTGSWIGLFVLSKIPELVDTLFLVIQKKQTPPFLHWYHHASVLTFAWMSYAMQNSTMVVFGCMNIFVHTIMYFYFAMCAMGFKKIVRRFAIYITLLQILQMVGGSALTFYSFIVNYNSYFREGNDNYDTLPCQVNRQTATFGSLMYLSYLYLFSAMFVRAYIKPKRAAPAAAAADEAKKVEGRK